MVASAYGLPYEISVSPPVLSNQYDLILAFDYENINTPIEETALKLKQRLSAIGLAPGHQKVLHIIAHSMGSLVTRWFVEREGGHQVVAKAVFVGPPNGGSPWAKIEDLVLVGLGAALNGLAAMVWPPSVIPALIGTLGAISGSVEKVDLTLDEMRPDSSFYKLLNASEDPGVPYVVVAGNTSKIGALEPAEHTLLERLVERLASQETRYAILSVAFFGQPNDMAVSVASMVALPHYLCVEPPVEIACDHVSYFVTDVGLKTVAEALSKGECNPPILNIASCPTDGQN